MHFRGRRYTSFFLIIVFDNVFCGFLGGIVTFEVIRINCLMGIAEGRVELINFLMVD